MLCCRGRTPTSTGPFLLLWSPSINRRPTEEHLVEELAGIPAQAPTAACGGYGAPAGELFSDCRYTAKARHWLTSKSADKSVDVSEAVHITPEDAEEELRDLNDDEAMTRHALEMLERQGTTRYELRDDTQDGGRIHSNSNPMNSKRTKNSARP